MRTIGVWCEHNFQIYSALPVIQKYLRTDNNVILFTEERNISGLNNLIVHDRFRIKSINKYSYKPALIFKQLFEILFVSENFSFVYKNEFVKNEPLIRRILRKIFLIKIPKEKVNKTFVRLNSILFKNKSISNYEKLDLLITFTKVYYSHLIPQKGTIPHINIMESWDHPMKFPYYMFPDFSLTWNKDLYHDTVRIQYINRVRRIAPLKFRYIFDFQNVNEESLCELLKETPYLNELTLLRNKKLILYPTTTSSSGLEHEGEMKLIESLCETFEQSDYYLYIKPKPNAPKHDYDVFKKYKNTIVGIYSLNANATDMLDDNYHIFRFLLLKSAHTVINAGTTFALEAALLDKKIIQLNLKDNEYLGFDRFCKTYHLNKYVLSLNGVFNFDESKRERLLQEIDRCSPDFSTELKKWITHWY